MKRLPTLFLFFILFMLAIQPATAFFTQSHLYWSIKGFDSVTSAITTECNGRMDIVLDGNTAADVPVLHYFDKNTVTSYISTHTEGAGYKTCLQEASTDVDKRCFCYGVGLHITQDGVGAHNEGGLVPKYLRSFFASNLLGHMIIERNFEKQHVELAKSRTDEAWIQRGDLDRYNSEVLNNLFVETGGDTKYLQLLKEMSGLDMERDAKVFQTGYLGGGFYNTVYKDKADLPQFAYYLAIGAMILGLGVSVLILFIGIRGKLKWILFSLWMLVFIFGLIVTLSFTAWLGFNTWDLAKFLVEQPPKIGYLSVSETDISYYDNIIQQSTNDFLRTGQVPVVDASGLTYTDKDTGAKVEGAISKAERVGMYLIIPIILAVFTLLNVWFFWKSLRNYRKGGSSGGNVGGGLFKRGPKQPRIEQKPSPRQQCKASGGIWKNDKCFR